MFKVSLLIALAVAHVASAQLVAPEAAPTAEPYSYGYETDSHAASEQRDPSGTVTGFYTLADADGRQRRVEYIADEAGFRAKVQTNELGTKSGNSADVEVSADPPTEAQLAPVAQVARQQQYVYQAPRVTPAPVVSTAVVQQPATSYNYGYNYPGYAGYGYNAAYGNGVYRSGVYGNSANSAYGGYGTTGSGVYSSYNNHLPSQYYRSVGYAQPAVGAAYGGAARYVSSSVAARPATVNVGTYRSQSSSYQSGPIGGYGYSVAPVGYGYSTAPGSAVTYSSGAIPAAGASGNSLSGSSNYIVLKKKREAEEVKIN